ncbi:bifunctional phosphoribosyl-AMP cyclohydrolase/phosphoribosyl-ATP diphosphatase HisIE [Lachnoclostridium sp. Marseille-P6806]|uniref:bifunctional phosphoribosyl-AMP cyclohydrolase/phosphoribosyl-ATP diphosphatase HisIE n=1 Tax=Lachnoclostridium sp. Marseille-P6806 TaxID=2364793 RepID=UPI0010316637|nr:bifunctional phosphoribosyl-AMP cyclohydrolase/phosphoribosyl-ATP diphosphatase HisIE [Lachnoclostridium sp. Marseille-P6806]
MIKKNCKKFIPCIFLYQGRAVRGLRDNTTVSGDPVELARRYDGESIDALLVFDRSADDSDAEHDAALEMIRSIAAAVRVPVIGAGHIKRMEDVKKLLYAGCSMAALNYSKESNIALTCEVSEKFGKNRIAACYRLTDDVLSRRELIVQYVQEMILIEENGIRDALNFRDIPTIICIPEVSLDKILELLSYESIDGITGNAVNDNAAQLGDIKKLCEENGIAVDRRRANFAWAELKTRQDGLIPVVVQEAATDEVLMVAYMNKEAYAQTVETGRMTYYSRSRSALWVKGETSGHFQYLRSLYADCDMDTLLARVDQIGPACHTGAHSCFFRQNLQIGEVRGSTGNVLDEVYQTILDRRSNPKEGSYTNYLFDKGIDKQLKKLGEEAAEIIIAAKNPEKTELVYEMADYLYHMMVVMAEKGIEWNDITQELARREQKP